MKWPVSGRPESKGDLLARFTETGHPKPTLGLMVDWLELVQKPGPQSRHAAIQALHQWILRRNKKLKNRRDFERLRSHLVEARNDAVHEQVSEKDALALCREAEQLLTEISDLPAPDDPFIHPKAAQRSKLLFVTASSRFRGRQLSSGGCATPLTSLRSGRSADTAPDVCPFFARRAALRVPRQSAGTGSAQIRRSMSPAVLADERGSLRPPTPSSCSPACGWRRPRRGVQAPRRSPAWRTPRPPGTPRAAPRPCCRSISGTSRSSQSSALDTLPGRSEAARQSPWSLNRNSGW